MLISNSLNSKITKNYINDITISQMHINYTISTNQSLPLDSLLINFIDNLQSICASDGYQKTLNKYLNVSNINDFLTVLHSIISNPQFIDLRSQALYSLSHALKKIDQFHFIFDADFFTTEVIDFYSKLLFDCDKLTELFSLSIINSILFDNFDESKVLLFKYDLPSLLINSDPDSVSPLFVSFSRIAKQDKMKSLFQSGFINHFFQKLINLISSKSIETSSNVMESLIFLFQNYPDIEINDFNFLQHKLILNLYSEDERCIELTLKLMTILNLPPLCHLNMIYMFVECNWTNISVEAIKLIQYFSTIFNKNDLIDSKTVLLRALCGQSFTVEYSSLMVLLSFPFFSILNFDEKKYVIESLFIFLNDNELTEECLKCIIAIYQEQKEEEGKKILYETIIQEISLFEDLLWSENENVVKFSQQILSFVEVQSDSI